MHLVRWLMASPLKGASKLYLGGDNTFGQLGDNTVLARSSPVLVSSNYWQSFALGTSHAVAVRNDGALFGWGNNDSGQVGNGFIYNNISSPVQIGTSSWTSVAAGDDNSYAIRKDGALFAWGSNILGQIGINATSTSVSVNYSWTQIHPGLRDMYSSPLTPEFLVAIRSDNKFTTNSTDLLKSNFATPGNNEFYPMPFSAPLAGNIPIAPYGNENYSRVYISSNINSQDYFTTSRRPQSSNNYAAIKTDGSLIISGPNYFGELGNNSTVNSFSPVQIGTSSWSQVCIEPGFAAAIRSDGALFTWGNNIYGQLGLGLYPGNDHRSSPVQVGTSSWSQVAINRKFESNITTTVAAIRTDGALFMWGAPGTGDGFSAGYTGVIGNNGATQNTNISFTVVGSGYLMDSAGNGYILRDGVAGDGTLCSTMLYGYDFLQKFTGSWTLVAGNYALSPNGALYSWKIPAGAFAGNYYGPEIDSINPTNYPQQVGSSSWSFISVNTAAGAGTVAAIRTDGALFTWGFNTTGQLGDGTTVNKSSPVQIGTSSWVSAAAGSGFTLAIRADGALFTWGTNGSGQLGDGTTANKSSPVQIGTSSWTAVGARGTSNVDSNSYAIRSDGRLFAWGAGSNGVLGDSTTVSKSSPVQVGTSSWAFIPSLTTTNGIFAIRSDRALFAWGGGNGGKLGDGTTVNKSSPVQIGTSSWNQVCALNGEYTLGTLINGSLYRWGAAAATVFNPGTLVTSSPVQIGNTDSRFNSPVQIGTSSWSQITLTQNLAHAIRSDGALFGWGINNVGQLGDNTTVGKSSPVQIGTSSWSQVWNSVGTNALYTHAIRSDGALFGWGTSTQGNIGDGTTVGRSSPVQIGTSSWTQVKGRISTYAIRSDGALFAWGLGNFGQTSFNFVNRSSPVQINTFYQVSSPVQIGTSSWSLVTAGKSYASAIRSDRALFAWGVNTNYNLGDGTSLNRSSPVQIGTSSWNLVNAGTSFTVGIASNSALYGWGNNDNFATGVSDFVNPIMGAGFSHGAIVSRKGRLYTWGLNNFGQLGDGTTVNKSSPIQIGTSSWSLVSGGYEHTLALNSIGQLYAWGRNTFGQLGDNTSVNKSSPVQIGTSSWTQIKAGISHSMAVRVDGALFTWGSNSFGQLGRSDTLPLNSSSPVQVGTSSWTVVATNYETAYAIRSDGSLFAWGKNDYGQIGNNSVNISGVMSWTQVAVGVSFSAGIRSDGGLFAWGFNGVGNLGDGTTVNKTSPVQIGTSSWTQISIGNGSSTNLFIAAVRADGGLFTWGSNAAGRLGSGTTVSRSSPVQVGTSSWTQIAINDNGSAAIRADGGLFTWGNGSLGSLGDNTTVSRSSPVQIGTSSWTQIAAGLYHFSAVRSDGALFAWGYNQFGQLGTGVFPYENKSSPVQIGASSWTQISSGYAHSLAIRTDGALFAWGRAQIGQLGTNSTIYGGSERIYSWTQVSLGTFGGAGIRNDGALFIWSTRGYIYGDNDGSIGRFGLLAQLGTSSWTQVSVGSENIFAIRADGALFAWGRNNSTFAGMLGNNTTVSTSSPVQIGTSSWIQVKSSSYSVKAIRSDGALFAWGNSYLGDGTNIARSSPVQIGTSSWTQVANADSVNLAIRSDGALFYWGMNAGAGLGLTRSGDDIYSWTQVKAGLNFTVALNSLGQLWTWGVNNVGQLGNGTTTNTSVPAQVGTSSWSFVTAGHSNAAAIRSDGRLFTWGLANIGQLGDITTVNKSSPVQVGTSSWTQVSIGFSTAAAIRSDGSLFTWGAAGSGALGDNTTVNKSSPVQIGTSSWTQVTAGWDTAALSNSTYAIRTDGALFAWGGGVYGMLGDNTTVNKSSPIQIGSSSWTLVRTANGYVGAIRKDGALFTWGSNDLGQLGNGQTETLSSPVQIGTSSWTQLTLGVGNFAIRSDGALFAWGWYRYRNNYATDMLGTGNKDYIDRRESWTAVAHSTTNTAAIRNDGALFVWGSDVGTILNPANSPYTFQPSQSTKVGNSSWTQVVRGDMSYLALRADGALFAWGYNFDGQLGDGTTVNKSSPVQIGTSSWTQIATSFEDFTTACAAIRTDGALFTWGAGFNGELGSGSTTSRSSPVQVGTSSWTQVDVGFGQLIAIRTDGALFTCGLNSNISGGQLGDSTLISKSSPVQIGTSSWIMAKAGSMAIRTDGALFTWGSNGLGQMGDGTTIDKSSPIQIGTSSWTFVARKGRTAVDGSLPNAYAIRKDGALFGWGHNTTASAEAGYVGDGTLLSRSSPVQIGIGNSWSFVSRGNNSCGGLAITTTGLVYIWGRTINLPLQQWQFTDTNLVSPSGPSNVANLPFGGTSDQNWPYTPTAVQYYPFLRSPVQVGTDSWTQISSYCNREHASGTNFNGVFGIRNNNKMYAWGTNTTTAPLGDNTSIPRSSPVQVGFYFEYLTPIQISTSSWTQVAADYNGTCAAISSNSRLYTWGSNTSGQVGDSTTIFQPNIQERGVYSWTQIATGGRSAFSYDFAGVTFAAIRSDGGLFTWGDNTYGQLGNNTGGFGTARSSPVQVGTSSWVQVSVGAANVLAIRYGDYTVYGWGANGGGLVGDNTTVNRSSPVAIGTLRAEKVYSGNAAFIIEKWTNTLRGWGYNAFGQVGDGTTITRSSPVLIGASRWREITGNYFQTIAIREDGGLFTWGSPEYGRLADNSTAYRSSPVQVGTSSWTQVKGSPWAHALAIRNDGALFTWGSYSFGQGGRNEDFFNGGAQNISKSWSVVCVNDANISAGIQTDGSLYIWGIGYYGESLDLTPSTGLAIISPAQVGTSSWSQVATGGGQGVLAIRTDGALFAWGGNAAGGVGDNTTINKSSPTQIGTSSWTQVAYGYNTAYAIRSDGALFSWGSGYNGVLGSNATTNRSSPVQVGTSSWSQIKASAGDFVLAIRTDGALFAWGGNAVGQVGDGTTVTRSSPVQIGNSSWSQIGVDAAASFAIRTNGSLFSWGSNGSGQLGDGTNIFRSSPVQIGTSSWIQVGPSIAIRTDGALFTWGSGVGVGLNDNINRSSPVQVGTSSWSIIPSINTATYVIRAALRSDRALFTWGGYDSKSQGNPDIVQYVYNLGLNGTSDTGSSSPVQVGLVATYNSPVQIGTSSWAQIAATAYTSSAVRSDGAIFTWGRNNFGQLGDNTTVNKSSPIQIGSGSWVQVNGNQSSFYGLAKDNTIYVWGCGGNSSTSGGALGNETTINRSSPVQLGYYGSWISVGAGDSDSLRAVRSDGALFAWGYNFYGQIGDGTINTRSSPVQIGTSSWTQVTNTAGSTGGYIRQDGLLYITGYTIPDNIYITRSSPVLVGPVGSLSSPVQIGTSSWIQVGLIPSYDQSRGDYYESSYARRLDGGLFAWGQNSYGQLGDSTTINKSSPVQIGTSSWTQVRGPGGILSNNTLYVWGLGTSGQIGDNTVVSKSSPVQLGSYPLAKSPIQIGTSSWTAISAGSSHAVAIRSNGSLFAWGANTYFVIVSFPGGQIGDNTAVNRSSPVQIGNSSWTAISAGDNASYGITSAKLLFTWGYNANGRLGDGTVANKSSPVQIGAGAWNDVSSDLNTAYATRGDGKLFAWGQNTSGQLGDNTTVDKSSPVQVGTFFGVPTLVDSGSWSFVSAGFDNSIGIDSNRRAYIWGNNRTSAYTWTSVTWGAAIRSDGALFKWSQNNSGQIGDGTTVEKSSPVQIGTSSWTQVNINNNTTHAIRSDGALFSWGSGGNGVLGDGTTVNKSSPVQIGTSSWSQVCVYGSARAIRSDGRLFAWGLNTSGAVGDNTTVSKSSPVQIGSSSWTQVVADLNNETTLAIRNDGALFAWGTNSDGRLGDGTTINKSSPVQIGTSSWTQIRTAVSSTFAIRSDGALFAWGRNDTGQLGDSTTVWKSSPVQIGTSSWTQIGVPFTGQNITSNVYFAIRSDGALFYWGTGQPGIALNDFPTGVRYSSPVQVTSMSGLSWTQINFYLNPFNSIGYYTLTQNTGKRYFLPLYPSFRFPGDEYPQLTPAEFTDIISYSSPTQIGVGGTWIKGSAGAGQNYLINNANVLYSWGSRLLSAGVIQTDSTITPVVADIDSAVANKAFNVTRGYIEK